MSSLKTLLNSAGLYTVANVLNSAIPFLLLPVLTRVLTPTEYGTVTMFATVLSVLSAFTGLSIHGAVSVRYFDNKTDHPRFVGTSLCILGGSTLIVLLVVWLTAAPLAGWTQVSECWLLAAVLASAGQFIIQIRLVIWQMKNEVVRYGILQIAQTMLNLLISLGLIILVGMGWEGRAIGILTAVFLFSMLSLYSLHRKELVRWKWDAEYARALLLFGGPLIPHAMGAILMSMGDKFIITSLLGVAMTGTYTVGLQLGMFIGVLADAFVKAYGPHLFKNLKIDTASSRASLVWQTLVIFLSFIFLATCYVALLPFVHQLIVGERYAASLPIAQLVGIGNAFLGMYYTIVGYLFFFEKTGRLAILTITVGITSLVCTYILVLHWGVIGGAWGYVASQVTFFGGAWYLAQKTYPLPWGTVFLGKYKQIK